MDPKVHRKPRLPLAPLVGGGLASVALIVAALFLRATLEDASRVVARGMGIAFSAAARGTIRQSGPPPWDEALSVFLREHEERGVRYVAVRDEAGNVVASAGAALAPTLNHEDFVFSGGVARMLEGFPGPREPRGEPESAFGPRRRQRWMLEMQYEPVLALQLKQLARRVLGVAALASGAIVALAVLLARTQRQREVILAELERGRRLAALGEMSTVLAHELRNPLASIKGHAQLLAETVAEDGTLRPRVDRLVAEAVRMERLMTDLLSFARTGELKLSASDPNELLRRAIEATEPARVDARFGPDGVRVKLDADRIHQALENVVRNALQADPAGRVEASVDVREQEIEFAVRDRGPGIPAGDEERIFEPFVTHRVRGVGLGLAITRRIVELHGGRVEAANRSGGGAEFRIVIPRREG